MSEVIRATSLDVAALPTMATSKVFVELVTDSLGKGIAVPVLVAKGPKPGPLAGITAAVHGNELNGIAVIHQLFQSLHTKLSRGAAVGVVVANVPGFHAQQREFTDGTHLNDIFPGRSEGNVAQSYAHRLIDRVIRRFDSLIDLHTASFGRLNSLYVRADMTHATAARMAYLLRPEIILHNPASGGTLRGAAMDIDIPAVTLEIADPHCFQPKYVRSSVSGVYAWLSELGLCRKRSTKPGPEPVLCDRSFWMYTDSGGLLEVVAQLSSKVEKGEVVARLRDAFGDVRREFVAPEDGVIIGKSVSRPNGRANRARRRCGRTSRAEFVPPNDLRR